MQYPAIVSAAQTGHESCPEEPSCVTCLGNGLEIELEITFLCWCMQELSKGRATQLDVYMDS